MSDFDEQADSTGRAGGVTPTSSTIRRGSVADAPALARIRREAILALAPAVADEDAAIAWAESAGPDRVLRAIEAHEVWLSEQHDEPTGWIEIDGDEVERLYVGPTCARRGIGSALPGHAERRILAAGYGVVRLDASPNAEAFYLARGYRRLGPPAADGSLPVVKDLPASGTRS